jgi:hypothetical protein
MRIGLASPLYSLPISVANIKNLSPFYCVEIPYDIGAPITISNDPNVNHFQLIVSYVKSFIINVESHFVPKIINKGTLYFHQQFGVLIRILVALVNHATLKNCLS